MHSHCQTCSTPLPNDAPAHRAYCDGRCRTAAYRRRLSRDAGIGHELVERAKHDTRLAAVLAELQ
jgi:predicted nucleic acid-binding Zn ribbon protein